MPDEQQTLPQRPDGHGFPPVVVASPIRLWREGLAEALSRQGNVTVVSTAADGRTCAEALGALHEAVVLLDLVMPDALLLLEELAGRPGIAVVALGVPEHEDAVIACAEAGAAAYVTREESVGDLLATLEGLHRGEARCSPRTTPMLLRRLASGAARRRAPMELDQLTRREAETFWLLVDGKTNKEIGAQLCISTATVKGHVHNILEKLSVPNRSAAAASVRRERAPTGNEWPLEVAARSPRAADDSRRR